MDYPKSVPSVGLVNGKFVDENPATGMPGSLIPASWGNAVTEELVNAIYAAGIVPTENRNDQLVLATSAPDTFLVGPEAFGLMSKSKMAVGMASVAQTLGMSTIPAMRPSTGAVPRIE